MITGHNHWEVIAALEFETLVIDALAFFGEPAGLLTDCDYCADGSVWLGLTQILPVGSIPG